MRKTGFTIAEFMISISIMCIIAVALLPVLFKKNKEVVEIGKKSGTYICSCAPKDSNEHKEYLPVNDRTCKISFEAQVQKEFFSIKLIGGGAGGPQALNSEFSSSEYGIIGGGAGEYKEVHIPSMLGDEYEIKLGAGGTAGQNGGTTAIYRILEDGSKKLIAYAKGGIVANDVYKKGFNLDEQGNKIGGEALDSNENIPISEVKARGRHPGLHGETIDNTICGKGGNLDEAGKTGEVIIEW